MKQIVTAFLLAVAADQAAVGSQVDWTWARDTPGCSLRQTYTSDGKVISVSRTPGNDSTSISLEERDHTYDNSKAFHNGKVLFLPGVASDVEIYASTSDKRNLYALSEDPGFLDKIEAVSEIEFSQPELGSIRVPLRSAAAMVPALRGCEDSRMREWGIDPASWRALKARPFPTKFWTEWIGPDDYPASAILEGQQGYVILRLEIAPDGSVSDCTSINRARSTNSRNPICEKLKRRAHFRPALAADGNAVAAPYIFMVQFRLE